MKKSLNKFLLLGVFISIPATLYGLIDSYFQISNYGTIGSASGFYSGSGYNLAVGWNNVFSTSTHSAAIGLGLRNYNHYSTVVGKYNTATTGALFIVGNGVDTNNRANALEVMTDGTVNIKKVPWKGGVEMGEFTSTSP